MSFIAHEAQSQAVAAGDCHPTVIKAMEEEWFDPRLDFDSKPNAELSVKVMLSFLFQVIFGHRN